jgi:hypothetical protein
MQVLVNGKLKKCKYCDILGTVSGWALQSNSEKLGGLRGRPIEVSANEIASTYAGETS